VLLEAATATAGEKHHENAVPMRIRTKIGSLLLGAKARTRLVWDFIKFSSWIR
jgi:hypothetical protein